MTPTLMNFFYSLIAGSVVVGLGTVALIFISQKDKIRRS